MQNEDNVPTSFVLIRVTWNNLQRKKWVYYENTFYLFVRINNTNTYDTGCVERILHLLNILFQNPIIEKKLHTNLNWRTLSKIPIRYHSKVSITWSTKNETVSQTRRDKETWHLGVTRGPGENAGTGKAGESWITSGVKLKKSHPFEFYKQKCLLCTKT